MLQFSPARMALPVLLLLNALSVSAGDERFLEPLRPVIRELEAASSTVPLERRELLDACAERIAGQLQSGTNVPLKFICTHNSRRSHLSQVWAEVAAAYFEIPAVTTSSGGTAVTACNPRTVRALRRSGFSVVQLESGVNPLYALQYGETYPVARLRSKLHDAPDQPQTGFVAMLCCSDADETCPVIEGAVARIPLHYVDPKAADGTPMEAEAYDRCSRRIGTEMFYLMSRVAALKNGTAPSPTDSE